MVIPEDQFLPLLQESQAIQAAAVIAGLLRTLHRLLQAAAIQTAATAVQGTVAVAAAVVDLLIADKKN